MTDGRYCRRFTENEDKHIRNLAAKGFTVSQIADELLRTYLSTIHRIRLLGIEVVRDPHRGIRVRREDPTPEQIAEKAAECRFERVLREKRYMQETGHMPWEDDERIPYIRRVCEDAKNA